MVFTDDCLEDGAKQINKGIGQPCLLNHDWTRLIGWTSKAWTVREGDLLKLATETEIPETKEETNAINQKYASYLNNIYKERVLPFNSEREKINNSELNCDMSCVYLTGKNILWETYAELKNELDEDGLLYLKKPQFVGEGFIKYKEHMLVPHSSFRESYSLPNTINRDFFSKLSNLSQTNSNVTIRLRIDGNFLGIFKSLTSWEQLDYWWGPKYNGNPFEIKTGVCVHGASKYDIALKRFKQTEFWWYQKDRRTFEIEEILEEPIFLELDGENKIAMRFIHSIFDSKTMRPCHLDGAVRLYNYDLFQNRKTKNIKEFGKSAERLKIWRIDGDISIEDWFDLIHNFFRNNFMIAEYFGYNLDDIKND
jgi:hypothetical protein